VSEVDEHGRAIKSFNDVHNPRHLSLDSAGRVLVADRYSHRILLLSSELQLQRVLVDSKIQPKLWEPKRLCYNERASELYVLHASNESISQTPFPFVLLSVYKIWLITALVCLICTHGHHFQRSITLRHSTRCRPMSDERRKCSDLNCIQKPGVGLV